MCLAPNTSISSTYIQSMAGLQESIQFQIHTHIHNRWHKCVCKKYFPKIIRCLQMIRLSKWHVQLRACFCWQLVRAFVDSNQQAFAIYECCIIQPKVTFVKKQMHKLKQFIRRLLLPDGKGKNIKYFIDKSAAPMPMMEWISDGRESEFRLPSIAGWGGV